MNLEVRSADGRCVFVPGVGMAVADLARVVWLLRDYAELLDDIGVGSEDKDGQALIDDARRTADVIEPALEPGCKLIILTKG